MGGDLTLQGNGNLCRSDYLPLVGVVVCPGMKKPPIGGLLRSVQKTEKFVR